VGGFDGDGLILGWVDFNEMGGIGRWVDFRQIWDSEMSGLER
jgi:hypothetical protein